MSEPAKEPKADTEMTNTDDTDNAPTERAQGSSTEEKSFLFKSLTQPLTDAGRTELERLTWERTRSTQPTEGQGGKPAWQREAERSQGGAQK